MKTPFKILIFMTLLAWMAATQSCTIELEKHKSNWETHPCEFVSDTEFRRLREGFSFKIIDATTFVNLVDTINAPIHPDSVRLFDANMNDFNVTYYEFTSYRKEYVFSTFYPYAEIPLNDADALLELDQLTFYLSTSYDDYDTIIATFEKCRLVEFSFNNQSVLRPSGENSDFSASLYFKK